VSRELDEATPIATEDERRHTKQKPVFLFHSTFSKNGDIRTIVRGLRAYVAELIVVRNRKSCMCPVLTSTPQFRETVGAAADHSTTDTRRR